MAKAASKQAAIVTQNAHQYVTFQVGSEHFGFPMEQVAEIIRLPQTVAVPLTPPALIGLANLRGNVLPVLGLRRILQMDDIGDSDATRVIITDAGHPVGLMVDRVARVMTVEDSRVQAADGVQTTTNTELLSGVIKDEEQLIQVLDVEQLIRQEFARVLVGATDTGQGVTDSTLDHDRTADAEEEEASLLVTFSVDDQEYAFDLMDVQEIVRVPEQITGIPTTDPHVLGLIDLRGRLLPLVSLRRMFQLAESELNPHQRILVVGLPGKTGNSNAVGIVVDEVREVLNVPMDTRGELPGLLNQGDGDHEVDAVCRLDNGKRLISILGASALFHHPAIQAAVAAGGEEATSMNNQDAFDAAEAAEEEENTQMVVFKLADQEYGVTIEDVQEITRVPSQMSKVPKTAEFIEGMVNLRGTVLPVLDMRGRFGLSRMQRNDRQRILVLNLAGVHTGFIMDSVVEVLRLNRSTIEPAPDLSADQSRLMGRVVNLKAQQRMIQVLDVHELLSKKERSVLKTA